MCRTIPHRCRHRRPHFVRTAASRNLSDPVASTLMISVAGIRGIVGESLTPPVLARFAAAFAAGLGPGPIVVGRDARKSGPMVYRAVAAGLTAAGRDVVDLGLATTPTTQVAVEELDAAGGIILTASHNPAPWNALKFLSARASSSMPRPAPQCASATSRAKACGRPSTASGASAPRSARARLAPRAGARARRHRRDGDQRRRLKVVVDGCAQRRAASRSAAAARCSARRRSSSTASRTARSRASSSRCPSTSARWARSCAEPCRLRRRARPGRRSRRVRRCRRRAARRGVHAGARRRASCSRRRRDRW